MKAKALRDQRDAEAHDKAATREATPSNLAAGQKRAYSALDRSTVPTTQRDGTAARPLEEIRPARNFAKYVEYDFSKMTDTKGGFLTADDDPHNKALRAPDEEQKPAHMTLKEWERLQLLRSLRQAKAGPFEPAIDTSKQDKSKICRECSSPEVDWKWLDIFRIAVCNSCKEKLPDKYNLLTKTEAREDYLLTDPELKDEELLPHLERPNPHKASWNNMMLYLRCQVEEYAFRTKWGSEEKLDAAFERREEEKKRRKQEKFKNKLQELKKRTRVEAYRRNRAGGAGGGNFGDDIGKGGKHEHTWGRPAENDEGVGLKTCVECGMEVEELEF